MLKFWCDPTDVMAGPNGCCWNANLIPIPVEVRTQNIYNQSFWYLPRELISTWKWQCKTNKSGGKALTQQISLPGSKRLLRKEVRHCSNYRAGGMLDCRYRRYQSTWGFYRHLECFIKHGRVDSRDDDICESSHRLHLSSLSMLCWGHSSTHCRRSQTSFEGDTTSDAMVTFVPWGGCA